MDDLHAQEPNLSSAGGKSRQRASIHSLLRSPSFFASLQLLNSFHSLYISKLPSNLPFSTSRVFAKAIIIRITIIEWSIQPARGCLCPVVTSRLNRQPLPLLSSASNEINPPPKLNQTRFTFGRATLLAITSDPTSHGRPRLQSAVPVFQILDSITRRLPITSRRFVSPKPSNVRRSWAHAKGRYMFVVEGLLVNL